MLVASRTRPRVRPAAWACLVAMTFSLAVVAAPARAAATCFGRTATVEGTSGDDTLTGTSGVDVIAGLGGDDTISGYGGEDYLCGGDGNDILKPGPGFGHVLGGAGFDDVRVSGPGEFFGGADLDAILFPARCRRGVNIDLTEDDATVGPCVEIGRRRTLTVDSFDFVGGTNADDVIRGNRRGNLVIGRGGQDVIKGRKGADLLHGGPGGDTLRGGDGKDLLIGAKGDDTGYGGPGEDACVKVETRISCPESDLFG